MIIKTKHSYNITITMTKPIIKWAGGKTRVLSKINSHIRSFDNYSRFVEPFVGGGSVFLSLSDIDDVWINDINPYLTKMYTTIKESPEDLISMLRITDKKDPNEILIIKK